MKALMLVAVFGFSFLVNGQTTWYLAEDKKAANLSVTDGTHWADAQGIRGTDSTSLNAGDDYVVRDGKTLRMKTGVFGGNSLAIGSAENSTDGTLTHDGGKIEFNSLILARGRILGNFGKANQFREASVVGPLTVQPAETPFKVLFNAYSNCRWTFVDKLSGGEATGISLGGDPTKNPIIQTNCYVRFSDLTDFKGRIDATWDETVPEDADGLVVELQSSFPGKLVLDGGGKVALATVDARQPLTISSLILGDGTALRLLGVAAESVASTLIVSDALTVEGKVDVSYVDKSSATSRSFCVPLIRAPKGVRLDVDKFNLKTAVGNHRFDRLLVERKENVDTLIVEVRPLVELSSGDSSAKGKTDESGSDYPSSYTNALHWSDREVPHADAFYLVSGKNLRTRADNPEDYDFPGLGIVTERARLLYYGKRRFFYAEMHLGGGTFFHTIGSGTDATITADVCRVSGAVRFGAYNKSAFGLETSIVGGPDAELNFFGIDSGTSSPDGFYRLQGDNTGFLGKIYLSMPKFHADYPLARQTLTVSSADSLGGPCDDFTFDALRMDDNSRLRIQGDVNLAASLRRGVFVGDRASIEVQDDWTFSMGGTLTLDGELVKSGSGTLILAGPLKFYSGVSTNQCALSTDFVSDIPRQGSNVLNVAEGRIGVGGAKSCDGLQIRLESGTGIEIAEDTSDPDLRRYGLYNVKSDVPFVLGEGLSSLPIALVPASSVERVAATNALVTVANASLSAVKAMMPPRLKPYPGFSYRFVEIPVEGEGATTIALVREPKGIVLIVR